MSRKKDSQGQDGLRVEQWPIERLVQYARNPVGYVIGLVAYRTVEKA